MSTFDWEAADRRLEVISANTVSKSSRNAYQNSYSRFISWALKHCSTLVNPEFRESVGNIEGLSERTVRTKIKPLLNGDPNLPPIIFHRLTPSLFIKWCSSLTKSDGTKLQYSAVNGHRAGLFNLFRDYNQKISQEFSEELSLRFKGLKRTLAQEFVQGQNKLHTGKEPMDFDLYNYICRTMIKFSNKDIIFARAFIIISWNLMSRSANVVGIRYSHMEWQNDALRIFFGHMKNDQSGERPRDPRHIYANPLKPEICPILALGLLWATQGFDKTDLKLFGGSNQYERFRKGLGRVLQREEVVGELQRRGITVSDLGTHSFRKGASTYCSSGSTACPSSTAVHLRAGWTLGGVQNTYLRYAAAGDMHVGRTVTGLPATSYEFAVLPPHFEQADKEVESGIQVMFPNLPSGLVFIAEHCLASLVFHSTYLKEVLHPTHRIFATPLFMERERLDGLKGKVLFGYDGENCRLRASGVPPHVSLLHKIKLLETKADGTIEAINETSDKLLEKLLKELELRALGAGTVTYHGLEEAIKRSMKESGINKIVEEVRNMTNAKPTEENMKKVSSGPQLYLYGGRFHKLPADFDLPECSVLGMWLLWSCGDTVKNIPALKTLKGCDMPNRSVQKKYSNMKFLMNVLEGQIGEDNDLNGVLTVMEATRMYNDSIFKIEALTPRGRKRRREQLSWMTYVNLLRKKKQREERDRAAVYGNRQIMESED